MQQLAIDVTRTADSALACALIDSVGRADFGERLLNALGASIGPDLISVMLHGEDGERPLLLDHRTHARRFDEEHAIRHYMDGLFRDDPVRRYIESDPTPGLAAAFYMSSYDVPSISYRQHCYDRAHIADRFTVACRLRSGSAVSINLYRSDQTGPLSARQRDCAVELAPMLAMAVARHCELSLARLGQDMDRTLLSLVSRFPTLTTREAQCAAGAIVGLTADEIGGRLGIKASSVITHRKRAYDRLGVSGQRSLVALYFGSA